MGGGVRWPTYCLAIFLPKIARKRKKFKRGGGGSPQLGSIMPKNKLLYPLLRCSSDPEEFSSKVSELDEEKKRAAEELKRQIAKKQTKRKQGKLVWHLLTLLFAVTARISGRRWGSKSIVNKVDIKSLFTCNTSVPCP